LILVERLDNLPERGEDRSLVLPVADPLDDFLKACLAILRPVEAATGRLTDEIKEFFVEDRSMRRTRIDSDRVVLKICSE